MNEILLTSILLALIVITVILIKLLINYARLAQSYKALEETMQRNNEDIAGLSAAGVKVDERLNEIYQNQQHFNVKLSQVEEMSTNVGGATQANHKIIQRINQGAGVEELMVECGVTRDEAELFLKMHRSE